MMTNLIYDRTPEDVAEVRRLLAKLDPETGNGLTAAEQAKWDAGLKGAYNFTDLNRVESAVKTLASALTSAGYPVSVTPVLKGGSRLPAGYTEVEWIQSSGTQYIDSGVTETADMAVSCHFDVDTVASDYLFGSQQNSGSLSYNGIFKNNMLEYNYAEVGFTAASSIELTEEVVGSTNNITINGVSHTLSTGTPQNVSMLIFGIRRNTGEMRPYGGKAKLRYFKIKKGSNTVRDFVPCKNPDGAVRLYDLVGGEFYTTPLAEEPVALPSGYTQIAYLQSTGTQYIDSGVKGDSDVRVTANFEITAFGSGTTFIFGAQGTDSIRYTLGMTSAGAFRSDFGTAMTSGYAASLNTRYSADKNGNVCTVGGQTLTSAAATFTGTTNIYLFGRSYSSISCSQIKMYRCKMYKGGTLIRDFAPCKNPDGVAGLYDTVNGIFYTNQGSGTFTAGADIVGFTAGAEIGKAEDREWQEGDVLYRSQWTTYLDNVQKLRDAYYTLAETGALPAPEDKLGYQGANNIEKVLADIGLLLDGMKSIYRRAGTFTAGGSYTRQTIRSI